MIAALHQEIDVRWFLPLFIGGWLTMSCLISIMGGWDALSKKYRSTGSSSGKLFSFASMALGFGLFPVSYRSCLFVRLDSTGIALSVLALFRFYHPPLLIPWHAVSDCRRERFWFMDCTAVYLAEPQTRMMFYGKLGREIYEARKDAA